MAPNQSIDVTASFVAPQFPGTYFATYRLTYGDNIEFGDKLYINIKVEKNDVLLKENVSSLLDLDSIFQEIKKPDEMKILERSQMLVQKIDD